MFLESSNYIDNGDEGPDSDKMISELLDEIQKIQLANLNIPECNLQIQCNPSQNTTGIFHRTRTNKPKFAWKYKRLQVAKIIFRKNKAGGIPFLDFNLYYSYLNQNRMMLTQKADT